MGNPLLLNTKEAAQFLHIGINQLRELARSGQLPVIRLHERTLRFYPPALEEWAKQKGKAG